MWEYLATYTVWKSCVYDCRCPVGTLALLPVDDGRPNAAENVQPRSEPGPKLFWIPSTSSNLFRFSDLTAKRPVLSYQIESKPDPEPDINLKFWNLTLDVKLFGY